MLGSGLILEKNFERMLLYSTKGGEKKKLIATLRRVTPWGEKRAHCGFFKLKKYKEKKRGEN